MWVVVPALKNSHLLAGLGMDPHQRMQRDERAGRLAAVLARLALPAS
jgi:hypothetical protein